MKPCRTDRLLVAKDDELGCTLPVVASQNWFGEFPKRPPGFPWLVFRCCEHHGGTHDAQLDHIHCANAQIEMCMLAEPLR